MAIKEISNSDSVYSPPSSKKRKLPGEESISTQQLKTPSKSHYVEALANGSLNSRKWKQIRRNLEGKPVQTIIDSPTKTPQRVIARLRQQCAEVKLIQRGAYKCFFSPEGKTIFGVHPKPDKDGKFGTFPINGEKAKVVPGPVLIKAYINSRKSQKPLREHLEEAIAQEQGEVARALDFPSK